MQQNNINNGTSKILNLLNVVSDSRFVTIRTLKNANFDVGIEIIYNIDLSKSNLCDYLTMHIF